MWTGSAAGAGGTYVISRTKELDTRSGKFTKPTSGARLKMRVLAISKQLGFYYKVVYVSPDGTVCSTTAEASAASSMGCCPQICSSWPNRVGRKSEKKKRDS
jgi:hypothetical protein